MRQTSSELRVYGFTLVELVTVLVLVGILSALGVGLFAGRSTYTPLLATNTLQSAALFAQQRALADADSGNPVSLVISQTAKDWLFAVVDSGTTLDTFQASRDGATLSLNGVQLGNGASQSLSYDGAGRTGSNTQVSVSGDSTRQLCISSMGLAYPGACQP
ncbi:prepilin-type N-terminal cleavage/methylation domain-containing protein [Mangrovitalea sediminis]|uniref:prepilin-type N-terminal cleavage/methylation domain-containing protein n=1 Tax=Mangrovitalea sediminis TaxID=1982043 RepID=UPI000BE574F8|nr:prepilin-type N-terminal cleavage/methylation domain-containing protein [Mangrovitalea sediminis]